MNFLFQETLDMFLKMNLTGKITWEVGEKYVYVPVSHTLLSRTLHIGGKITHLIGKKIQQRGLITKNMKYGRHSLEDILGSNYFPIVDFNVS